MHPRADMGRRHPRIRCRPVAIAVAVLRYRLFEIDRIISRTIGWALVTGVLVAVFVGGVIGLQALLTGVTQGETLAVAASTLVAFALFQPVRRRVQRAVDRRFDRARYDAERRVAAVRRTDSATRSTLTGPDARVPGDVGRGPTREDRACGCGDRRRRTVA